MQLVMTHNSVFTCHHCAFKGTVITNNSQHSRNALIIVQYPDAMIAFCQDEIGKDDYSIQQDACGSLC